MYGIRGFRLGTSPSTFPTSAYYDCSMRNIMNNMCASRDSVPLGLQLA